MRGGPDASWTRWALAALALCCATFGMTAPPASAGFRVSPTTVGLERDPGIAALGTIGVELEGEGGGRFRAVVEDIGQRPDGTQVYLPASGTPHSASSWLSVSPAEFRGGPDRTQPVQFRVAVPADAEPGDHLASITIQRLGEGGREATASAVQAVSVRLTIRVRGAIRPAARIEALEAPGVADGGPVAIVTVVRNSGNATLDFDGANPGRVTILDGDDTKARLAPFSGTLYPGQAREFVSRWEDPPLLGDFDALASVEAGGREVREQASFTVVPWREIGALLLVAAAAVIAVLGWRRRQGY